MKDATADRLFGTFCLALAFLVGVALYDWIL